MSTFSSTETARDELYAEIDSHLAAITEPEHVDQAEEIAEWLKREIASRIGAPIDSSVTMIGAPKNILTELRTADADRSPADELLIIRSRLFMMVNERIMQYTERRGTEAKAMPPPEFAVKPSVAAAKKEMRADRFRRTMVQRGHFDSSVLANGQHRNAERVTDALDGMAEKKVGKKPVSVRS